MAGHNPSDQAAYRALREVATLSGGRPVSVVNPQVYDNPEDRHDRNCVAATPTGKLGSRGAD